MEATPFVTRVLNDGFFWIQNNWAYYTILALIVSTMFIHKDDSTKKNVKRYVVTSLCIWTVIMLSLFTKHELLLFHGASDYGHSTIKFMIVCWALLAVAFLIVSFNFKIIVRRAIAILCTISVLLVLIYPSVSVIRDRIMLNYSFNGSYSISDSTDKNTGVFDEMGKVLTLGQKDSGCAIDEFDVNLTIQNGLDVSLAYKAHIHEIGWYEWSPAETTIAYDNDYPIDVVQFMIYGKDALKFNIEYRIAYVGEDWQQWVSSGYAAGTVDNDQLIEAIEIRLTPTGSDFVNKWTVTQFSAYSYDHSMFYTIRNNETGTLIVVDGGGDVFSQAVSIINLFGGQVDYWFITHPDYEHAEGYNIISQNDYGIEIGKVYDLTNYPDDTVEIEGLIVEFFDAVTQSEDWTVGSLMFKISGEEQSVLFCSDAYCLMNETLIETYGDSLCADYIEIGCIGNSYVNNSDYIYMKPQTVFLDYPNWMGQDYAVSSFMAFCEINEIGVYTSASAPNSVPLD